MSRISRKPRRQKPQIDRSSKGDKEKRPVQLEPSGQEGISRRFCEVLGILTLASALLLGPSLVSVQWGKGTLMGPFGLAVGSLLNWALGLAGYLVIFALLVVALRIFAGGLGLEHGEESPRTLWRERFGMVLGTVFGAALLHLMLRPYRISGASPGGLLGEVVAEVLCSIASTAGAWVLSLTGFALSLVLGTNLSWARTGVWLWQLLCQGLSNTGAGLRRARAQLREGLVVLVQTLRRRELSAEAGDGTAALPPVLRLDGGYRQQTGRGEAEEPPPPMPLPGDLEIGGEEQELPTPAINLPPLLEQAPPQPAAAGSDLAAGEAVAAAAMDQPAELAVVAEAPKPEDLAVEQDSEARALARCARKSEDKELTIVQPRFGEQGELPLEEQSAEQQLEETDGPGFVLKGKVYKHPPFSLLEYERTEDNTIDREAIYRQADLLVKTLADYKINGRVTEVHPGPVVTMYEFVPAPGTRISKIANLTNDLAMSLAAQRVRIVAPIPGKGAVGIEVPNERRETVFFKEIIGNDSFKKSKSRLSLAMGKNIFGAPVTMDLAKMPHLLVAGATGAGKSVSINAMICSLLMKSTPEEVRLIMVDPKFLELSGYNDIPHLMLPVVTDPKKANIALRWAVNEMERRYQLLADMKVRDIVSFNRKVDKLRGSADELPVEGPETAALETLKEAAPSKVLVVRKNADGSEEPLVMPGEQLETAAEGEQAPPAAAPSRRQKSDDLPKRLPYIVVVIDEFADLMMVASKEVETSVARLAQKARAAGIHVILATQRPSVDVITGLIKANFPSRVSFQVASNHDSKTILGTQGAENLLGAGDMLVLDRGADMKRIHGAYISDREIQRIVDWLREQGKPVYDMDILKPQEDEESGGGTAEVDVDEMYDQAVALVAETRQASISMIQRRLRVGYNRAARMVERMERDGIVSPPDGVKGREVLVQEHAL